VEHLIQPSGATFPLYNVKGLSFLKEVVFLKLLQQLLIVLVIFFIGQALQFFTKLPIPGSVIGMMLLLVLLCSNIISIESLRELADFCLGNLAFFFVPVILGVITSKDKIMHVASQFIFIVVVSTCLVMAATGVTAQYLLRRKERRSNGNLS
jgi:holin-like protein